jgi:predicted nucleic acid-binding protein
MRRVLIDTGPLVALFNRRDAHHAVVKAWLKDYAGELATCWAVLAEVCHLLPDHMVVPFLRWAEVGGLVLVEIPHSALKEITRLVEKYNDRPMDLADAALVWLADDLGIYDILTVDHNDFAVYRTISGKAMNDVLLRAS